MAPPLTEFILLLLYYSENSLCLEHLQYTKDRTDGDYSTGHMWHWVACEDQYVPLTVMYHGAVGHCDGISYCSVK